MTHEGNGSFENIGKKMEGFLSDQWRREVVANANLQSQIALAKVDIPAYLNQRVLDVLPNVASLVQPPAVGYVNLCWPR